MSFCLLLLQGTNAKKYLPFAGSYFDNTLAVASAQIIFTVYYYFNKSQNSRPADNGLFEIVSIWLKVFIALTSQQAFAGKNDT